MNLIIAVGFVLSIYIGIQDGLWKCKYGDKNYE
jgi:hypothetical protein